MARKFGINIILYSEDNIQFAHCLEFDIVAQGRKKIEALKNLLDAIELQMDFAIENNDIASIFNPAPVEYWKMLVESKKYPYKPKPEKKISVLSNITYSYITG